MIPSLRVQTAATFTGKVNIEKNAAEILASGRGTVGKTIDYLSHILGLKSSCRWHQERDNIRNMLLGHWPKAGEQLATQLI
jgi:hypothetical protein